MRSCGVGEDGPGPGPRPLSTLRVRLARSAERIRPPDVGRASGWKPRPRVSHAPHSSGASDFGGESGGAGRARRPITASVARLRSADHDCCTVVGSVPPKPATAQHSWDGTSNRATLVADGGTPRCNRRTARVDRCLGGAGLCGVAPSGVQGVGAIELHERQRTRPVRPLGTHRGVSSSRPGSQRPGPATGTGRTHPRPAPTAHPAPTPHRTTAKIKLPAHVRSATQVALSRRVRRGRTAGRRSPRTGALLASGTAGAAPRPPGCRRPPRAAGGPR